MITRKVIILFSILLFTSFTLLNAQAVSQTIKVSSGTFSQVLSFGMDTTATDGIDITLGESALPPVPPGGIFDARFKLSQTEYSWKDYRQGTSSQYTQKIYKILFSPNLGDGIKIEWDLPAGYNGNLKDAFGGIVVNSIVKGKGEVNLTSEQVETVFNLTLTINYLLGTLTAPTLIAPVNNATDIPITQTFSWNAVTNAVDYLLVLAFDNAFTDSIGVYYPTTTSYEKTGLPNNNIIYWKVLARNSEAANPLSPSSAIRKFTTIELPPEAPTPQTPADNTVGLGRKIKFTWDASERAVFYKLQIANDANFNNIFWEDSTITDDPVAGVNQIVSGFSYSTDYWYRVSARNGAGNSPYSSSRKFSIVPIKWSFDLAVANNGEANKDTLRIGTADAATELIDPLFEELSLPPLPPGDVFDVRLKLSPTESSMIDFRPTSDNITYTVLLQSGSPGYPINVTWDNTALPEGQFILKDAYGGSLFSINMKTQNSYSIADDEVTQFKIVYTRKVTVNIDMQNSWNIISVPVTADNMNTDSLFATSLSPAWKYDNGYIQQTPLEIGAGYWLRMPSAQTIAVSGQPSSINTVSVKLGWNLIGPYDKEVPVSEITTTPTDILNSKFFGYGSGYIEPTKLLQGKGYWIRVKQAGTINFNTALNKNEYINIAQSNELENSGRIILKDASGNSSTLYLSNSSIDFSMYDLPPVPPDGIFDARFTSGRMAESATSSQSIVISSAKYPVSLSVDGISIKIIDELGIERLLKPGSLFTFTKESSNSIQIRSTTIPLEYNLMQNYPNPFNPTTSIRFTIPEKAVVKLTVYNMLGEEMNSIINKELDAGLHQFEWNANGIPSGIYLYKLTTDKFTSNKKMILIK
ncbi:MAG: T9SS type A sorting domain-containing protein [Melioribacteraceae bacterium]|nr:T9SS type A sorting domain-containing protein [Melioribacteraceae bacterium]